MNYLLSICMFLFLVLACDKDPQQHTYKPTSTTQPNADTTKKNPLVNYPYDSIHRIMIGNWYELGVDHNGVLDTYWFYRITYDSIISRYNSKLCENCPPSLLKPLTEVKNYKFYSVDTFKGEYNDFQSGRFFPYRTPVKFITKDKIVLVRYRSTNLNIVGMDTRDVILERNF